jgi:cyclophilin family peptidyl-prolyl cis-trans isomerase
VLAQLKEDHPNDLRVVYRHFPLVSIHDKALLATQASEAAARQGEFWAMHDLLYDTQSTWAGLSPQDFEQWVSIQAAGLDLDATRFTADMRSQALVDQAQQAWDDGRRINLPGTPFLLINGQIYNGPHDIDSLDRIIRLILLGERQFTACPPQEIDPHREYIATLVTERGEIVIQLFADKAPLAVNNFVFLARQGWYEDVTFHRVIPGFVAQSGDPSGTGTGSPGYIFQNEIDPNLKFDRPGLVGMANAGPDTNGSQFFITYGPAPHLDGNFTIFGQVLSGMDVLAELTPREPQPGLRLPPGDRLIRVIIEER